MSVTDIGIDLVSVGRFAGRGEGVAKYFLSPAESAEFSALSPARRPLYLATHWACKEAIFKATGDRNYTAYTLSHREDGKPFLVGRPDLLISISHDNDFVVVIIEKTERNEDSEHE